MLFSKYAAKSLKAGWPRIPLSTRMALPNTIIAGAPKSGSSSLYWWLSSHPEVCASKTKETHYFDDAVYPRFNASANYIEHGLGRYEQFFEHCTQEAKVIMEATPIYLYQENALQQLSSLEPKPKINSDSISTGSATFR